MNQFSILPLSIIVTLVTACSTTPIDEKPNMQSPLKLSEANETMNHSCGSYGCDDQLRERCEGSDFRILSQDTANKYNSRKNNVTGGFDNNRTESVNIVFKCLPESSSVTEK